MLRMDSRLIARFSAWILAFSAVALLQGCANTTQAGAVGINRSQLLVVPSAQINQQAAEGFSKLSQEAAKQSKLNKDAKLTRRVRHIGERLIAHVPVFREDAAHWDWEINVFESEELNAFCAPGGKIGFYTGIIRKLDLTDTEIAAIMGHEISHALREHSREKASQKGVANVLLSTAQRADSSGLVGSLGGIGLDMLVHLPNSRAMELESDVMGLELMARAGFDPRLASNVWVKMAKFSQGKQGLAFLSTHPQGEDRIALLESKVEAVLPLYEQAQASAATKPQEEVAPAAPSRRSAAPSNRSKTKK